MTVIMAKNISFFSLFSNPDVRFWLNNNIFVHLIFMRILAEQGEGVVIMIVCLIVIVVVVLMQKALKTHDRKSWVVKVKHKLMWGSVLRSCIQTYLPMVMGIA